MSSSFIIPEYELEFTTSRSGGAGGQHVNRTDTRVTVRWNVFNTTALAPEQKERIMARLAGVLTHEGDLIVHSSDSRSQMQNRKHAVERLTQMVVKALKVPKKRMATKIPREAKEARLKSKAYRSTLKRLRNKKLLDE